MYVYVCTDTVEISDTGNLILTNVVEAVQKETKNLRDQGCHIVIGVGHYGYQEDKDMAELVDLDVIIGGHSHTLLYTADMDGLFDGLDPADEAKVMGQYPTVLRNVADRPIPICHAFEYGKYLGHIDFTFTLNEDRFMINSEADFVGKPIILDASVAEDPDILAEMERWRKPVDELSNRHIGETEVNLDGDRVLVRRNETNLGNFIADAIVESWCDFDKGDVHLAIVNSGGIRGEIPVGEIDYGNVLTVLPFGGSFDVVQVKGSTLMAVFDHAVSRYESDSLPGEFLQVSGFQVSYDTKAAAGKRVVSLQAKCGDCAEKFKEVEMDEAYWVGTSDFVSGGGDGFDMISNERLAYHKELFSAICWSYIS